MFSTGPFMVLLPRIHQPDALLHSRVQRLANTEPSSGSIQTRREGHHPINTTQEVLSPISSFPLRAS